RGEVVARTLGKRFAFAADQRLGKLELARRREAVHDVALGATTYPLADLALEIAANILAHRGNVAIGLAEFTGEVGVDLRQHRLFHLAHRDLEAGGLAGEFLGTVILRERHRAGARFAGLHAAHRALEVGEHPALAEDERKALCRAALEGDVIDLANEIDRGLV